MNQYEIMSLLMRLETNDADPYIISTMYAETLAAIAGKLTEDEMRRLLIVGAYVCNKRHQVEGGNVEAEAPKKMSQPKTQFH